MEVMEDHQAPVGIDSVTGINFDFENKQSCNKLLTAVMNGDEKLVKRLLKNGWSPNACDNVGRTALHLAARASTSFNIMKMLLDSGGYVDHVTHTGASALFIASYSGLHNTVALLLDHGADVNIRTDIRASVLHFACHSNHPSIGVIRLLLDAGVRVDSQDDFGTTPLMLATQNKSRDAVRYLIDKGADVTLKDTEQKTAFHIAASCHDMETFDVLMRRVPRDVAVGDIADREGFTLLMFAAQVKAASIVSRLLEGGCCTATHDNRGILALHLAAHNSEPCFQLLLDATPPHVINETCGAHRKPRTSLPCLLIDAEFFDGLKLLLSKNGLNESVLNCPLVKDDSIFPPVAFLFHSCDSPDFARSVVELYLDRKLPLDPVIDLNPPEHVFTCLETLVTSHYVDHAVNQELCSTCYCAELFVKMLENGARADPYGRVSEDIEKNKTLFNFCVHNSLLGLSYLLKFSNYLEPFWILRVFTNYIFESDLVITPFVETIQFLCKYCYPWEIAVCKKLLSENSVDIEGCYDAKNYPFPSLRHICRGAVRNQLRTESLHRKSFAGVTLRGSFLQTPDASSLPESLVSYLQYDDAVCLTESLPRKFTLNATFQRRLWH